MRLYDPDKGGIFINDKSICDYNLSKLREKIGITPANLSILKNQKAKAIRFSTLEEICRVLDCQPGDILEYRKEEL